MVWFKQLQAFWCTPPADKTQEDLEAALAKQVISDCPSTSTLSYGWENPINALDTKLLVTVGRFHCAKFTVAKRLLPLDVIRQTVADRVSQLEAQQGMPVSKREIKRLTEETHFELLPKAFIQKKSCFVIWDWDKQRLYVSQTQQALLDHLSASLAFCIPGWSVKLCKPEQNIEKQMTRWLKQDDQLPSAFAFGDACQLADPKDRFCSIRFTGNELQSESVQQHLKDGMWVKQVQLQWQERLRFMINPNFALSQIKYLDLDKETDEAEGAIAQFQTELALLGPLYREITEQLADSLGGIGEPEAPTTIATDELVKPFSEEVITDA